MQINFDKGLSAHFDKTHERFLHILSVIYFFAFLKTVGPIEIQTDVVLYNLHLKLCQSNPPSIQEDHGD